MIHNIKNSNHLIGLIYIAAGIISLSYFGGIQIRNQTIWIIIGTILIFKGLGFIRSDRNGCKNRP